MTKTSETKFFSDNAEHLYDFSDEFLVQCPKCQSLAKVVANNIDYDSYLPILCSRKFSCSKCGLTKIWQNIGVSSILYSHQPDKNAQKSLVIGGNFDWYFQEPLWLQINCCGETLWAYNQKHLEFIENYVAAKLRRRNPNVNKSLASRLPNWIKSAKNRDEILKAIGKLKEKLNGKS